MDLLPQVLETTRASMRSALLKCRASADRGKTGVAADRDHSVGIHEPCLSPVTSATVVTSKRRVVRRLPTSDRARRSSVYYDSPGMLRVPRRRRGPKAAKKRPGGWKSREAHPCGAAAPLPRGGSRRVFAAEGPTTGTDRLMRLASEAVRTTNTRNE